MADDNVDWRFLGRQVQNLQGEVRNLRADQLRLESDVTALRADIAQLRSDTEVRFDRLETEMRTGFKTSEASMSVADTSFKAMDAQLRSIDTRFDQLSQSMADNLQVVLAAIGGRNGV